MTDESRASILVVDDRPENVVALEATLEPLGQQVVSATSGADALKALLSQDFAVILLDVMMPGMDGFETAARIRERDRTRNLPIIFLTAMGHEPNLITRGYDSGAVDYMFKPVDPNVLRAKVQVFIELHRQQLLLERQAGELAAKSAELERSNADLEQFSFVASHDLQEPLRLVAGYLELIGATAGDQLDDTTRDWLARATTASQRMSILLTDLLAYARVGGPAGELEPVPLDEALDAALDNLALTIAESDALIDRAPLPVVSGTRAEFAQLFQNLVGNALKFRRTDRPEVAITAERAQHEWLVSICDNGIGVPESEAERVFAPFERVDRSEYPGSGLGLAVCQRVVERFGGRIWIDHAVAQGTAVRFTVREAT